MRTSFLQVFPQFYNLFYFFFQIKENVKFIQTKNKKKINKG
jgi:hypothetical protein